MYAYYLVEAIWMSTSIPDWISDLNVAVAMHVLLAFGRIQDGEQMLRSNDGENASENEQW